MDKKALAEILRHRAADMMDKPPFDGPERRERLDTSELIAVLARVLEGKPIAAAFGAPGDWGYKTPIGAALAAAENKESA